MDIPARPDGRPALTAAAAAGRAKRDRLINVALVFACQACHHLTFFGIALFLPLIREDLQITYTQAGVLSAAVGLSYALCQIPAGYLADRFGARRLFFIGLMGWSFLSLSLGLIHSYWLAVLNLFVAGAFRALLFAPGLRLLASWFPPERGATAMSLYMVGGYAGNILLALVGPTLAAALGWRPTFILFAVLGVAAAIAYWTLGRARPGAGHARPFAIRDALRLFEHRILWICGAIQFVRFSVVTGFSFWLPSLLVSDRGFSLQATGLVLAMSAAFSVPANALGGYLSDRIGNPPLVIGGSLAALACASILLVWVESVPVLLLVIAASSALMQLYFGPLFFVPLEVLGHRAAGTATGFCNLFANLGGLTTAYALGAVKDATGSFTWGFISIGGLCIIGAALSAVLARMRDRALAQRPGTA